MTNLTGGCFSSPISTSTIELAGRNYIIYLGLMEIPAEKFSGTIPPVGLDEVRTKSLSEQKAIEGKQPENPCGPETNNRAENPVTAKCFLSGGSKSFPYGPPKLITGAQRRCLLAVGSRKGLAETDIEALCNSRYVSSLDNIDRKSASQLIDYLKTS